MEPKKRWILQTGNPIPKETGACSMDGWMDGCIPALDSTSLSHKEPPKNRIILSGHVFPTCTLLDKDGFRVFHLLLLHSQALMGQHVPARLPMPPEMGMRGHGFGTPRKTFSIGSVIIPCKIPITRNRNSWVLLWSFP